MFRRLLVLLTLLVACSLVLDARGASKHSVAPLELTIGSGAYQFRQTLQSNLHQEEQDFLDCLAEALSSGTCTPAPAPVPDLAPRSLVTLFLNWLSPEDAPRLGGRP